MDGSTNDFWPKIERLGARLGASSEAMRKWRARNKVPGDWHLRLLSAAEKDGIDLSADELLSTTNNRPAA